MTWIKLDDNAVDHPKVESLSDRGFRWWVKALSYASRFLTDGRLPPVFWKKIRADVRKELTGSGLWDWHDPDFLIHDYDHHQSLKTDVEADKERNREKSKAYRERRRSERQKADASPTVTGNEPGNVTVTRDRPVTDPENREHIHIQRSEIRTTTGGGVERGVRQMMNGADYERLRQFNAYVGARLKVPTKLHDELLGKSGNRDLELRQWYALLDEELEATNKGTGDVFAWLRPRHQSYALARGWVDAAPTGKPAPQTAEDIIAGMKALRESRQ